MALRRRATDAPPDFFPGFAEVVEIGTGSVSTVYRGREIATGRWFALKLFDIRDAPADALPTFERDSSVVTALAGHPNIVTLYGAFWTGSAQGVDARPVQVLELCSTSVDALLRQAGAVPVRDAISLGVKIAGALESAHRAQLLHGDVKPQNLLVTESGQPALADFGLAALRPNAAVTAARAGASMLHVAPELFERGRATPAADVYSLAATLYHLVAGRPAFGGEPGEQPAAVIARIVRDPVLPLSAHQAPPRLSALLLAAMSKDERSRPPTAAVFAAELGAIEAEQRWPRTEFVVHERAGAPPTGLSTPPPDPSSSARSGWTPPPAETWFPPPAPDPPSSPRPASTAWSEPIRSAPRHARPDDDEAGEGEAPPTAVAEQPAVELPSDASDAGPAPDDQPDADERDEDGLSAAQYAAFEAAAVHAPPTTINPIMPGLSIEDPWSDVSLSAPARPRPGPVPRSAPDDALPMAGPPSTVGPDAVDPGVTSAHPLWRQERAAAAAESEAAESTAAEFAAPAASAEPAPVPIGPADQPAADATVQHVLPIELNDPNLTVARYPIPPPATDEADQAAAAVPAWAYREPEQPEPPAVGFGSDLTIDPMSLRRRVTIRAGAHALVVDDSRIVVRAWLHRSELAWSDVIGFEPRFDGVGASGSGGRLVAITRRGPVELPATKRSMADLRYVQALLDAYRHRAQMSVNG